MSLSINGLSTAGASALRQAQAALLIRNSTQSTSNDRTSTATQRTALLEDSDGLRAKVQDAIEEAIKSHRDASPDEMRPAVDDAVKQTLEDNGVDSETVNSALAALAQGGPPPGPPPGGPPPAGGPPPSDQSASTSDSTSEALDTLLDSDLSFAELLQQILAAAEQQTGDSDTTTTTGTTGTTSTTSSAIESLLSSGTSLEDLVTQLASAWREREAQDEHAARMAYTLTSALFGPAVNAYA